MRLRTYIEQAARLILEQLNEMSVEIESKEQLTQIAESLCYDPPLAKYMGEVFDIIGEWGRLEIRKGRRREVEREYSEGMYWDQGLLSREMFTDLSKPRVEYENGAILISDLDIVEPDQLLPVLELALRSKIPSLLIVAASLSDRVVRFLMTNKAPERLQIVAVKTPGWGKAQEAAALKDLAILTGGRPFIQVAGDTLRHVKLDDLGWARCVWADYTHFGIVGGKGNARALRQHIAELRRTYENTTEIQDREALQKRIGKLMGGSATLWIGGATEMEVDARVGIANRTSTTMRAAMMEGVVPGGGMGLLACRPALRAKLDEIIDSDERAAYHIVLKALEEPFRTIVSNAGYDDSDVMAEVRTAGAGYGFDVAKGEVVEMAAAGIYDATAVQKAVVYGALNSAAMALTVDVIVHHAEMEQAPLPQPTRRKQL